MKWQKVFLHADVGMRQVALPAYALPAETRQTHKYAYNMSKGSVIIR